MLYAIMAERSSSAAGTRGLRAQCFLNSQTLEDSDVAGIITEVLYGDCDGEGVSGIASDDDVGGMRDGELTEVDSICCSRSICLSG